MPDPKPTGEPMNLRDNPERLTDFEDLADEVMAKLELILRGINPSSQERNQSNVRMPSDAAVDSLWRQLCQFGLMLGQLSTGLGEPVAAESAMNTIGRGQTITLPTRSASECTSRRSSPGQASAETRPSRHTSSNADETTGDGGDERHLENIDEQDDEDADVPSESHPKHASGVVTDVRRHKAVNARGGNNITKDNSDRSTEARPGKSKEVRIDDVNPDEQLSIDEEEEQEESLAVMENLNVTLETEGIRFVLNPPSNNWEPKLSGTALLIMYAMRSSVGPSNAFKIWNMIGASSSGLVSLRGLLPESPGAGSTQEATKNARIAALARAAELNKGQDMLSLFHYRNDQVALFQALEQTRPEGSQRTRTVHLNQIAEQAGMSREQLFYHRTMGKKILTACGGHRYLGYLLPLSEADLQFNIRPRLDVNHLRDSETAEMGRSMGDSWATAMCLLGQYLDRSFRGDQDAANTLQELAAPMVNGDQDDCLIRLQLAIRETLGTDCSCHPSSDDGSNEEHGSDGSEGEASLEHGDG